MNRVHDSFLESFGWSRQETSGGSVLVSSGVLEATGTAGGSGYTFQVFPARPGDRVKLSCFARKVSGDDAKIWVDFYNAAGTKMSFNEVDVNLTNWKRYTVDQVCPEDTAYIRIGIGCYSSVEGVSKFHAPRLYLPDFNVYKGTWTPELNFDDVSYTNQQGVFYVNGPEALFKYFIDTDTVTTTGTGDLIIPESAIPLDGLVFADGLNHPGTIAYASSIPFPTDAMQLNTYYRESVGVRFEFLLDNAGFGRLQKNNITANPSIAGAFRIQLDPEAPLP